MKVLGTDKQFAADDDVETDLHHDWNEEEQRELDDLEGGLPDSWASSRKHEHAQTDVGGWLMWRTTERVEEQSWKTAEQRQRPDDGQHGKDSTSTTDDVRVDRMYDRYVSEIKPAPPVIS